MAEHNLSDEFLLALQSLFDWFGAEGVPGTSIGGVAVSLLAQPRVTHDIDAVIWLEKDLADMDAIASATPHLDVQRVKHWVRQFAEVLEMPEIADSAERVLSYYSAPVKQAPRSKQPKNKAKRKKDK